MKAALLVLLFREIVVDGLSDRMCFTASRPAPWSPRHNLKAVCAAERPRSALALRMTSDEAGPSEDLWESLRKRMPSEQAEQVRNV